MKYLMLFFLVALCNPKKHTDCVRQITIEHIGNSDKPVASLLVANQNTFFSSNSALVATAVLNNEDFDSLKKCVISFKASVIPKSLYNYEFGTFRVIIKDSCNKTNTFIFSPKRARILFQQLKKVKINNKTTGLYINDYLDDIIDIL